VFALTNTNPSGDTDNQPAYTAVSNGKNWAVSVVPSQIQAATFLRGSAIADIASGVNVNGPAAICFDPLGRLVTDANVDSGVGTKCGVLATGASAQVYEITSASAAGDHPLNIEVGLGGQARLCNPAIALDTGRNPDSPGASEGCHYSSSSP
jgi:type IV fimbrial biogenesis protein FimT